MFIDMSSVKVGDTLHVAAPDGWHTYKVRRYIVTRITPKGQVVAQFGDVEIRVSPRGSIIGGDRWSRTHVTTAERVAELEAEARERQWWFNIRKYGEAVSDAAICQSPEALNDTVKALAQAIEVRRAETGTGSVEDESAVPEGNAPNINDIADLTAALGRGEA